ncbi:MAG: hypothetical protein FJ272_04625 [Planctomycetes bacterium]|nr:hypothetical protein [Planctomycetota bacterium]
MPPTQAPCPLQPEGAPWFDATANSGRALEAIVWLYEATDEPLALDLAARIADHHLRDTVHADGAPRREILDPNNVGHNHSCTWAPCADCCSGTSCAATRAPSTAPGAQPTCWCGASSTARKGCTPLAPMG